jgi:acetyl-CoA carboxylase biotin carboxyl carrier protein
MATVQPIRHSEVWVWMLVCLLSMFLVLAVLTRVAGADSGEPQEKPATTYIISLADGTFVAGAYHGAEPYVGVGSRLETGTVVANVKVWRKLHPVSSMVRGTIVEVLVVDGTMVVTGQALFKVQIEAEPTPA